MKLSLVVGVVMFIKSGAVLKAKMLEIHIPSMNIWENRMKILPQRLSVQY
jgi:hypothetical protein